MGFNKYCGVNRSIGLHVPPCRIGNIEERPFQTSLLLKFLDLLKGTVVP